MYQIYFVCNLYATVLTLSFKYSNCLLILYCHCKSFLIGCCEVIFEREMAVLELLNEVCSSALGKGNFTLKTASECRKAVNDTCGVDIAAFVKRNENVGKTTKTLMETMKNSNSSCLKQHFGVGMYSLSTHLGPSSWNPLDS